MDFQQWSLPGPAALLLSISDVAKVVGVNVKTIVRMIESGEFPEGKLVGKRLTWTGQDLAAYLHLRGRYVNKNGQEKHGQSKPVRGQGRTNKDKPQTDIEPE